MSDEKRREETARWLRFAQEDLDLAIQVSAENGIPRHSCLHAQQAAEKAMKSAFVWIDSAIPRSHDLEFLQAKLPGDWKIASLPTDDLSELSLWAVESRYPGDMPEATPQDANRAISIARGILEAIAVDLVDNQYNDSSPVIDEG